MGSGRGGTTASHPTVRPPTRLPASQHERQRREDREDARQRPHRGVALAEHRHPAVEEPVVERRMAVVTQRRGDVADRKLGDVDRQRLVEPEVRLGPEAEDELRSATAAPTAIHAATIQP